MCSQNKKQRESKPLDEELAEAAIKDLSYVPHVVAAYVLEWCGKPKPTEDSPVDVRRLHNALLEVSLLFVRKTTEFFLPKGARPERADNLYAWQYLDNWGRWVIADSQYDALHKAVGHMTIRGVRYGKDDWPIEDWTERAIDEWLRFYARLSESRVFRDNPPQELLRNQQKGLEELATLCRRAIANEKAEG